MVYTPTRLYEALQPTLFVSNITGTLPVQRIFVNGKQQIAVTKRAKFISLLHAFVFTLFFLHTILDPYNLVIFNYYQAIVSNLGLVFELIGGIILVYMIYIFNYMYNESVCAMFTKCNDIDANLKVFNNDFKYKYIFYYQIVHIVSGLTTFFFTTILQQVNSKTAGFQPISISLGVILLGPLLIIFIMETQYTSMLILLRFRFEYVNKELEKLNQRNVYSISNKLTPVLRVISLKKQDLNSIEKLEKLMFIHDALCDIVDIVNFNYGLQILISIGLKFVISVYSIFNCYWSKVVKNRTWSAIFWALWSVYNFYELVNLSVNCQRTTTQARNTGTFVHKLLLSATNPSLKEKLNIFSQQLIHRQVRFTALELFPIDATLLLAIISSGSTYLIIMIQFQDSDESSKKKNPTFMLNSSHYIQVEQ